MKACPFCAEEIQDAAVVCKHCSRDLSPASNPPRAEPLRSAKPASTAESKRRILAFSALAVLLLIVVVAASSSGDDATMGPQPAADVPQPAITRIADNEDVAIEAEHVQRWTWTVTEAQPNCRVTGHLEVIEGGNRDVQVFVSTEDAYKNIFNGHKDSVSYQTEKVTALTLDVPTAGAGRYVLAVSNAFSLLTPKRVRAEGVMVTCR